MNKKTIGFTFLLLCLQMVCLSAFSQQAKLAGTFTISGDLSHYKRVPSKVLITLLKPTGGYIFDSVMVSASHFEFKYELKEPMLALLSIRSAQERRTEQQGRGNEPYDYISVYAIPSTNVLKLKDSTLLTATIEGGAAQTNQAYQKLYNKYTEVTQSANKLIRDRKITDRAAMVIIRDSLTLLADETVLKPYILSNPNSIVSIRALMDYSARPYWTPRKNMSPVMIEEMLSKLPAQYKQLPGMLILSQSVTTAKKTLPGKVAMDFAALDTSGKEVHLSDFKGKTVFIDFWASWCVPCRKENPNVKKLYQAYKDKGLVVLSVSLDNADKREAWLKAIKDDGIDAFVHISELKGFAAQSAQLYDVKSIPTNFIVDPQGNFVARNIYGEELAKKFAAYFEQKSK